MSGRAERWWRPSTTRRPAQRARARRTYTGQELDKTFDIGYTVGQADERKRHERRPRGDQLNADFDLVEQAHLRDPERFRQLAEAVELGGEEGKEALERLAREWGVFPEGDDLFDVADAAGVLADDEDQALSDSVPPHGSGMVVEIEQWLRDRGRWLDFLRENGELPDDKDGDG